MAPPLSKVYTVAKTVWKLGSWVYAFVDEVLHERKMRNLELQRARRVQSERYREASHTAGKERQ